MKFLIALLTAATGLLHILVGFGWLGGGGGTMWMLVLNGVGYLVLLALYWTASGSRGTIRWILLIYTLITLVGYFIIGAGFSGGTIPLVIKAIELLDVYKRQLQRQYAHPHPLLGRREVACRRGPQPLRRGIDLVKGGRDDHPPFAAPRPNSPDGDRL